MKIMIASEDERNRETIKAQGDWEPESSKKSSPKKKRLRVLKDRYLNGPRVSALRSKLDPYINNRYFRAFILILAIFIFILSIEIIGSGFKHMGKGFSEGLIATMSDPISAVFIAMLATALIQSSSATTVMTVGFVNAGLLTLRQAISIVLGANIGTTLTAWLVSFLAVFKITRYALPAIGIGFFLTILGKRQKVRKVERLGHNMGGAPGCLKSR